MKNWKYAFYCQKGISHGVCQDYVDVYADDTRIVACLCDGLGSLKNSDVAAKETVKNVIDLFRAVPNAPTPQTDLAPFRRKLTAELQRRLKSAAAERNMALDSMDCTLLFACLFLKQNMAIIGCLGDSALCVIRDDKAPALFCDSGFIGTRAVLDHDAAEHLQCAVFPLDGHVKSILLTSDGLENEIYCKGLTHVAKNTELYLNAMLRDKPEAIMQKRVEELTAAEDTVFDDDISVAVLSCLDRPVRLEDDPTWPCVCGAENLLVDTFCSECSRDFLDLYKNIDFKGDRAGFFRYIRRNPNAKQALMSAIADGSVPFTPAMRPQPAQPHPTDDHTVAYAAPEQTAPLQPTGSLAPEQTMPPRRVETKSAKKTNTVMLAVVVAAVVVSPTKRHEKKPTENGENGEAGTSVELPTESEKSTGGEQPTDSRMPDYPSAGESVNPEEMQRAAVTTIIPIILTIPMISIMTGTLTDNRKTADKQNRQTLYFAWMCRYSVFYNIHN